MTMKKQFALLASLLLLFPMVGVMAESGNFVIEDVDYDDPIAPGASFALVATLSNMDSRLDVEDVEVKAWLVDQFGDRVTEKAVINGFQVQQDSDNEKTMYLRLPATAEEGEYSLVVEATGRWEKTGELASAKFESLIDVEQQDDSLLVKEIRFTKSAYKAGDTVDVAVTVMNNGNEDQNAVTVSIAVPGLDIYKSATLFGTLFASAEKTLYFTFDLPEDSAGINTVKAAVSNGLTSSSATANLVVDEAQKVSADVSESLLDKEMTVGQSASVDLKVTNRGAEPRSYLVTVDSEGMSASVGTSSFRLAPGESKVVSVELTAESAGQHTAVISVEENSVVINNVTVNANVTQGLSQNAALFILLVLVIAGIVLYMQYNNPSADDKKKTLYY
jgi:hypothetical protein